MAERDAAVHAARALLLQLGLGERELVLLEVVHALGDRALPARHAVDLQEAADLTHCSAAPPRRPVLGLLLGGLVGAAARVARPTLPAATAASSC